MTVKWLDRSLIAGPYLCLVLSERDYHRALDHLKVPRSDRRPWIDGEHAHATVHFAENPKGELCTVVCLKAENRTGIEIAGLLTHEAVHIFQRFCRRIGESEPSDEFEAYSIQCLSQQLWWSFQEQTHA